MARLFPSNCGLASRTAGEAAELATLEALQAALPDGYTIFHGVHWADEHRRGTAVGELDFAVVNQAGDILLVEQKAGDLQETDEGLVKSYAEKSTNVANQVHRALNHVQNKYAATHGEKPRIDYLVYLPHHRLVDVNAAGIGAERIVHAGSQDNLTNRIGKTLGPGKPDPDRAGRSRAFFRQELRLVPSVDRTLIAHEQVYTRLAEGLACLADRLEMNPWRVRVIARAGSGKTQLAQRFLESHASGTSRSYSGGEGQGEGASKPLYVCFNRPLAERMEQLVPEAEVHTFHSLCRNILETANEPFEAAERGHDPAFWKEIVQRVTELLVEQAPRYQTLVVDEGQDFEPEWYELLRLCVTDDADILWLEDPLQDLFNRSGEADSDPDRMQDFVVWRTHENHRSGRHIARYLEQQLDIPLESHNDLPGDPVEHISYNEPKEQIALAEAHIEQLLVRGFTPDQIAILTVHGLEKSVFSGLENVGSHRLKRFTGGYDEDGHQRLTAGKLAFDSVYRYKGQQSPAVILADVDFADWRDERTRKVLYTGMTRAGIHLAILQQERGKS